MTQPINVRGIDLDVWRQLRAVAVRRGLPIGELLNSIIRAWLAQEGTQ